MRIFKSKIFKILFVIITSIITIYVIWTLGKPLNYPWSLQTKIDDPQYVNLDENNNIRALIDHNYTRISYFNESGQTIKSNKELSLSDSYTLYHEVYNINDTYFVHKANVNINNGFYNDESLIYFNINNNTTETIFNISYNTYADKNKYPNILDIKIHDNKLFLIVIPIDNKNIMQLITIDKDLKQYTRNINLNLNSDRIFSATYNKKLDTILYTTFTGDVYKIDESNTILKLNKNPQYTNQKACLLDNGDIYISHTLNNCIYKLTNGEFIPVIKNVIANSISCNNNYLVVCDSFSNSVKLYAVNEDNIEPAQTIKTILYSQKLSLSIIFAWIAYLYLAICLIFVLVYAIKGIKKITDSKTKLYIFLGFTVFICIVSISLYFSFNIYKQAESDKYSVLKIACQDFINNNENEILDIMENDQSADLNKTIDLLLDRTAKTLQAFSIGETEIKLDFLKASDVNTVLDVLYERIEYIEDGSIQEDIKMPTNNNSNFITSHFKGSDGDYLMAGKYVYDVNKEPKAFVISYCSNSYLIINQLRYCLGLIIALLVISGAVVLICIELNSFSHNIKKSIKIKRQGKHQTDYSGARILMFLHYFIYTLDTALVVLIVQDMIPNTNIMNISILLSLPLGFYFLGGLIGCLATNTIIGMFKARNVLCSIAFLYFIFEIVTAFSIINTMFVLFCVAKLICGFLQLVFYNGINLIQYRTNNVKQQALIANDQSLACISSGALGVLCAGHMANLFGNQSIYILAAIFSILSLLAVLWFIPNNVYYLAHKEKSHFVSSKKSVSMIFTKPEMLIIIFGLCFVSILINQYNSILFPLFADSANIDKAQIGNIAMFATCTVFLFNSLFKKKLATTSQYNIFVLAFAIMSFGLLCFSINDTILWASLVLILTTLGYRLCSTIIKTVWIPLLEKDNIEQGRIFTIITTIKNISSTICPTIISAILIFGAAQTAFIIGSVSLISLILYGVIMTIKHKNSIYRNNINI